MFVEKNTVLSIETNATLFGHIVKYIYNHVHKLGPQYNGTHLSGWLGITNELCKLQNVYACAQTTLQK